MRVDFATDCMARRCPASRISSSLDTARSVSSTDASGTAIQDAGIPPLRQRVTISGRPSLRPTLPETSGTTTGSSRKVGESRSCGNAPSAATGSPQPSRDSRTGLPVIPRSSPRTPGQRIMATDSRPAKTFRIPGTWPRLGKVPIAVKTSPSAASDPWPRTDAAFGSPRVSPAERTDRRGSAVTGRAPLKRVRSTATLRQVLSKAS